uniref:Protein transport protein Sec24D n=1 Tax=Strongyloides papillosus TaxID=174720 RepID=A0A0N5CDD9_STREA
MHGLYPFGTTGPQQTNMPSFPQPPPCIPELGPPNITGLLPPGMPGPPGMVNENKKNKKLDPEQVPSVVKVREDDKYSKSGVFLTGYPTAELPPLVTTNFTAHDQGNSSPRFIRSTLYSVPTTNEITNLSHLPFAVSCRPFAKTLPNEYAPPIVNFGDIGPIRCQRCRAYMCPFMKFIDGGRRFNCPFCDSSTPVIDEYFAHLDHNGRRIDISQRAELCLGSYDFVANSSYCRNNVPPNEPAFIFMLDVSYNAIKSGLVKLFCMNFKRLLSKLPKETYQEKSTIKIGFVTYDSTLHFYNLSSQSKKPEMAIVNDLDDIFIPFVDGLLVDASEAEESISRILDEIPKLFNESKTTNTCLGPVIQAGLHALKITNRNGKLFVFNTSLPMLEAPGKLVLREGKKLLGSEEEKNVLSPNGDFYNKLGEDCTKNGVFVDLFLFPNSYTDIASLSPLVSMSGGHLYKYQYFNASEEGHIFLADFENAISRDVAFDGIMRIRTSPGLRPVTFYGHFMMENPTDMEFGGIDSNKEVLVEIKYDGKLPPKEPCFIQAAILYTSVSGQRRIRIHNISLNTTDNYLSFYKNIDSDTLVTYLYKYAENIVKTKNIRAMKEEITTICAHILATYRGKCSENPPFGQLLLPESLKLLPLYFCCIIKNDGLTGGPDLNVDDRAWLMNIIGGLTTNDIIDLLYPRIIPVTQIYSNNNEEEFYIPTEVRGSYEYLKETEAYLIKNGTQIFLWIGRHVHTEWIRCIFNVNNYMEINTLLCDIPEYDNPYSRGLRKVAKMMSDDVICHSSIKIIPQGNPLEAWMKRFLVEDCFAGKNYSYIDALCLLHREIRLVL